MKLSHATVFGIVLIGIAFLAYKNQAGLAGMMSINSDGSALGGPVYSSIKARTSVGRLGAQPSSVTYGQNGQGLQQVFSRFGRGQ